MSIQLRRAISRLGELTYTAERFAPVEWRKVSVSLMKRIELYENLVV
ncbi:MAG: hypothetical protein P4M11_01225 [Candidatus Pacebacteria bacterium]|nr:hypothetical protein [Candidatus Paceibacterota bacterium]